MRGELAGFASRPNGWEAFDLCAPRSAVCAQWPTLGSGEVHVWTIPLDVGPHAMSRLGGVLAPEELAKFDQVTETSVRRHRVVSRAAVRLILSCYLGVAPVEVRFVTRARGKPGLLPASNPAGLQFNLAHSGELALLAVGRGRSVGVDVERIRPGWRFEEVSSGFFAPSEVQHLALQPRRLRREAFYAAWCRKEAYLKGLGLGVGEHMRRVEVSVDPRASAGLLRSGGVGAAEWGLLDVPVLPGYRGCLAVEGNAAIAWLGCLTVRLPHLSDLLESLVAG